MKKERKSNVKQSEVALKEQYEKFESIIFDCTNILSFSVLGLTTHDATDVVLSCAQQEGIEIIIKKIIEDLLQVAEDLDSLKGVA